MAAGPAGESATAGPRAAKTVVAASSPRSSSVTTPVQVATPTGRRARPVAAARLEEAPRADAPAAVPTSPGTGRRRKPAAADPAAESAAPTAPSAGTGQRRKPAVESAPLALAAPVLAAPGSAAPGSAATGSAATGSGRRRKVAEEGPAAEAKAPQTVAVVPASGGTGRRRKPDADVFDLAEPEPEAPLAPVIPISTARRPAGATGSRRKAKSRAVAIPGTPALVAGAAAVAVAAAGVLGAAGSSASGRPNLASTAGFGEASAVSQGEQQRLAERAEARASRERARTALAKRQKEAAVKKAKQVAVAKALKLAKERADRLARLAKSYRMPVQGYRLTAGYGDHGLWSAGHTGTDFACPYGTAIRAVGSGRIVSAGWDGAYGWKTVQVLNDGTEIWYAHQSKMLVRSGYVNAGDVIGRVGSSGRSTGPHLHLEVRVDGKPINPIPWLRARGLMR
ncbi:MAG: peptidoglycan DD-metalloendopeptidase family protein [Sporichthyaceae bacterium]